MLADVAKNRRPYVAAGLARNHIAKHREHTKQGHPRRGPAGASYRKQSIPHEMEPNHPRALRTILKVAKHGIAQLCLQRLKIVRFGEDGHAQRARRIPALWGFLNHKDDLVHVLTSWVKEPAPSFYCRDVTPQGNRGLGASSAVLRAWATRTPKPNPRPLEPGRIR